MSAIPAGLSFLATMATNYPAFHKAMQNVSSATNPPPTNGSVPVPQQPPINVPIAPVTNPVPTAPMSVPAVQNNPTSVPATQTTSTPASSPPNASSASNLCEHCHTRPKFFDGSKTHSYCGKSCAAAAKSKKPSQASGNCVVCHSRPKYFDGSKAHDYCSKSCAQKVQPGAGSTSHKQNTPHPNPAGACQIPGCTKPAHKNTNGSAGRYCGLAHKTLAENACLMCRKVAKQGDRHFCGQNCMDESLRKGPMILEVPENHATFRSIEAQFKTSWRHAGRVCPTVRHVYKICMDQTSLDKYDSYRASVEARGHFVAAGRSAGNENRRWHGTKRECQLGDKGQTQFCSSTSCSLCCIMKTSYDISLWGKKTGWGRFGAGIYTSSTSSKSNDYASNTDSNASLKAILLNKVVVGKGVKMTQDNTTMTAPPAGYDSVLAEKGSRLNHDELVVYTNDAIRPSYLVMYDAK